MSWSNYVPFDDLFVALIDWVFVIYGIIKVLPAELNSYLNIEYSGYQNLIQ